MNKSKMLQEKSDAVSEYRGDRGGYMKNGSVFEVAGNSTSRHPKFPLERSENLPRHRAL